MLEAKERVGGRGMGERVDGFSLDMGAFVFTSTYDIAFRICEELGLPLVPSQMKFGHRRNGRWVTTTPDQSLWNFLRQLPSALAMGFLSPSGLRASFKVMRQMYREAEFLSFASDSRLLGLQSRWPPYTTRCAVRAAPPMTVSIVHRNSPTKRPELTCFLHLSRRICRKIRPKEGERSTMNSNHALIGSNGRTAPAPSGSFRLTALTVLLFALLALVACGGGEEEVQEDASAASSSADAPAAEPTVAAPAADAADTSAVSLDEYIRMVCGEAVTEVSSWEGGDSLSDLSAGLAFITEQMRALDPPVEVAEWHDAQIAFAGVFKETIDDFLDDPGDRTEDEFLISMFFTVAPHFEPVEAAIASMDPDVRARMAEAGCIDEETSGTVPVEPERTEVPVGGSVDGELAEPDRSEFLQFEALMGQKFFIEVAWEGFPELYLLIKDPPDPVVDSIFQWDSESSPLSRRWTAPESGTFHVDVGAYEGTGTFVVSISRDTSPEAPLGLSAAWEGSTVRVSWQPAEGAEYYKVYHDDLGPGCQVDADGNASFCDELATDVTATTYVHSSPRPEGGLRDDYYWVTACNSSGCARIDSENPVSP